MRGSTTVVNREHPHNMCHDEGQKAKAFARGLSNTELDDFLQVNGKGDDVISMTRAQKIRFIKSAAMSFFVKTLNENSEVK